MKNETSLGKRRDNMVLVGILSTEILLGQFIHRREQGYLNDTGRRVAAEQLLESSFQTVDLTG
jgi:hypothetical protein